MLNYVLITLLVPVIIVIILNFSLFISCKTNRLSIGFLDLLLLRLKKINPNLIVESSIRLSRVGIVVPHEELQRHYLSGGDLAQVVEGLISSSSSKLSFSFEDLCRINLAGRDVESAVESYVRPIVIHCPESRGSNKGREYIVGVTQDGIRLGVQLKVTVRADINKLIGGAGESTVRARVGEGVISSIGHCRTHKDILERPEKITEMIHSKGLLSDTAYELVSIDILEIEIIDNIGAKITSEQSDADTKVAQAAAESQKVEAIAVRQEMKAKKRLMQSQLVLSRATLPAAMASAFNEGNLGHKTCSVKEVFIK